MFTPGEAPIKRRPARVGAPILRVGTFLAATRAVLGRLLSISIISARNTASITTAVTAVKNTSRLFALSLFFFLFSVFCFSSSAFASCVNPTGNPGETRYYGGFQTMEYCDGASWVAMGPVGDARTGLVGWWKLDETSGTSAADSSGSSNTGTTQNGPTWTTSGMNNGALTLNGTNQLVAIPDVASLQLSGSWTIATWVNFSALPTSGNLIYLINKPNSVAQPNYQLSLYNNSGVQTWQSGFYVAGNGYGASYAMTISTGVWYHAAVVWDSSTGNVSLYVNGALVATQNTGGFSPVAGAACCSATPAIGGQYNGTYSTMTHGTLDDARIYNRALTAQDVMTLYTSTGPLSGDIQTGLIHYWKLDEAPGATTAIDIAGGANITLAGTATFATGGKVNNDLSLPNDSSAKPSTVATPANILGKSTLTISEWVKRAAAGSYVQLGQENTTGSGGEISIEGWSDGRFYLSISPSATTQACGYFASNDTNWHLVTLVFDGTQTGDTNRLKGYLDGVQQTLTICGPAIPATTFSTGYGFYIGYLSPGSAGVNDAGTFDDVRVYNRALSQSDVLTLYNTYATACAGSVGYAGDMLYNGAPYHVLQFCNGTNWVAVGPLPGAGGSGCTGGTEGDLKYNADKGFEQYCDGTNWIAIGQSYYGPQTGLVGWYKLDEGSGTTTVDSSATGNSGWIANGTVTWVTGIDNRALTFLASSSPIVSTGTVAAQALSGSWTVSGWVNLTSIPSSSNAYTLFSKGNNSSNDNYALFVDNGALSAGLGFAVDFQDNGGTRYYAKYVSTPAIGTGTWYLLTGTWDGTTLTLYVNGASVATSTPGAVPYVSGTQQPLHLGEEAWGGYYMDGTIDDARIYNRALSASEVWQLYLVTGGQ